MAVIKRFEDLEAWQGCRSLTKRIYMMTEPLLTDKKYSLADQMRRAAVSAMSNIAEVLPVIMPKNLFTFSILHKAHYLN